jgi:hypothetical protein
VEAGAEAQWKQERSGSRSIVEAGAKAQRKRKRSGSRSKGSEEVEA